MTSHISRRPTKKTPQKHLSDVHMRFLSIAIIALIYLQIIMNGNISVGIKWVFAIFTTAFLMAFFRHTLKKWYLTCIGFNTMYFLDPEDKSLRKIIVPRWYVSHTDLPSGTLAISIPQGGFLNTPCVFSERVDFSDLWRVNTQENIVDASVQYVQLTDYLGDRFSLPMEEALLFLESKQRSPEFFPNWMDVLREMRESISHFENDPDAYAKKYGKEYVAMLEREIEKFKKERGEFHRTQKKMFVAIHKSIKTLSIEQPSIASEHITAFVNLLIKEFEIHIPSKEETNQKNITDHTRSTAA